MVVVKTVTWDIALSQVFVSIASSHITEAGAQRLLGDAKHCYCLSLFLFFFSTVNFTTDLFAYLSVLYICLPLVRDISHNILLKTDFQPFCHSPCRRWFLIYSGIVVVWMWNKSYSDTSRVMGDPNLPHFVPDAVSISCSLRFRFGDKFWQ